MPDDDAPVAAWRMELRSIEEDEVVEESKESSDETELITVPNPSEAKCG
jgi:hypothetical protein